MADFITPQIIYDPGTGPVTLAFTYPPINKPGDAQERVVARTDSDTLDGHRQSFYERIDKFWTIDMPQVPFTDLAAWEAFVDYALTGGTFNYYPDSTLGTFITYTLDDKDWKPAKAVIGFVTFKMRFRLAI